MTLPASGYLQLGTDGATGRSINSEYGYGNDLASYLGVYYGRGGQVYRFPVPGNLISIGGSGSPGDAGFYSSSRINPGSTGLGTGYWTVPIYNTISAYVQGGQGGQSGAYGFNQCPGGGLTGSAGGQPGNTSSFGGYVAAGGGNGGNGQSVSGNAGAAASGSWTNPVQGGGGPASGSQIYITVGTGGGGGGGGSNCAYGYGICVCAGGNVGSPGANGAVNSSWS